MMVVNNILQVYLNSKDLDSIDVSYWSSVEYIVSSMLFLGFLFFLLYLWNRYSKIKFPEKFLMDIDCLNKVIPALRKIVTKPTDEVTLDFSNVSDISEGAYMAMLAQVEKAASHNKKVFLKASTIKTLKVWQILTKDKSYKHKNVEISNDVLGAEFANKLYTDEVDELVEELKKLGFTSYYQPFYDFLVELIGNSVEHGIQHKNINWWLWRERDSRKKCFRYVFVDMGVGIINSYKESQILPFMSFLNKQKLLLDAFDGRLGSTTGMPGRGRGLPQIKDIVEKGLLSDFVLITNNVSLQYKENKFITSNNPNFVGMYCSWTISKSNFTVWKNIQ